MTHEQLVHPISDRLIQLRLPGMKKAFDEQRESTNARELGFEDRLSLLLERESVERERHALSVRLGRARFKQTAALEDVRPSASRGLEKSVLISLGQCDWVKKKCNLIVTGPSGCGKTFLATALSHKACLRGYTARYFRARQLAAELESSREEGRFQKLIEQLGKIEVLVIDDIWLSSVSEAEEKDLFELIEERHGRHATIFTSQNPVSVWHGLMPNPAIADAILDRVSHGSVRVELKGESMRKKASTEIDKGGVVES